MFIAFRCCTHTGQSQRLLCGMYDIASPTLAATPAGRDRIQFSELPVFVRRLLSYAFSSRPASTEVRSRSYERISLFQSQVSTTT